MRTLGQLMCPQNVPHGLGWIDAQLMPLVLEGAGS